MNYVKLLDQRLRRQHRLALPVTIGSSRLCDIIVNSSTMPGLSLVLHASAEGQLVLTDIPRGHAVSLERLEALSLTATGPIAGQPVSSPKQRITELAVAEKMRFRRLPREVQTVLGGFLPQKMRLTVWAALPLLVLLAIMVGSGNDAAAPSDSSNKKLPLVPGTLITGSIGAVKGYPAYRKGFTFAFTPNATLASGSDAVLYFDGKDLDENAELKISVNGQELWTSTASPECINAFCKTSIAIPGKLIAAGENIISAVHAPENSSYLLKNLLLTASGVPTAERRAQIAMVYARAKRAFDERAIVLQNLLTAKDELERLDSLLIGAKDVDSIRGDSQLLRKATDEALEKIAADLSFNGERAAQLGHYDQSEKIFKELLTLFPQPDDKTRLNLEKRLREIKELQK